MAYYPASPDFVLFALKNALKDKGIKQAELAKIMGYASYQSVSNMLRSNLYLKPKQAKILSEKFGYDYNYLTAGVGSLMPEQSRPEFKSTSVKIKGELAIRKMQFEIEGYQKLALRLHNSMVYAACNIFDDLAMDLADAQSEDVDNSIDYTPFFTVAGKRLATLLEQMDEDEVLRKNVLDLDLSILDELEP